MTATQDEQVAARVVARSGRTRRLDARAAARTAERAALDVLDPALRRRLDTHAALGLAPAPRGWWPAAVVLVLAGAAGPAFVMPNRRSPGWVLDLTPGALTAGLVTLGAAVLWGPFTRWTRGTTAESMLPVPRSFSLLWALWFTVAAAVTLGRLLTDDDRGGLAVLGFVLQLVAVGVLVRTWATSRAPGPDDDSYGTGSAEERVLRGVPRAVRETVLSGAMAGTAELVRRGRLTDEHAARAGQLLRTRWGG